METFCKMKMVISLASTVKIVPNGAGWDRPGELISVWQIFANSNIQAAIRIQVPCLLQTWLPLDDTLIFDHNGNMIGQPADSIRYTMILKNQSGSAMSGGISLIPRP